MFTIKSRRLNSVAGCNLGNLGKVVLRLSPSISKFNVDISPINCIYTNFECACVGGGGGRVVEKCDHGSTLRGTLWRLFCSLV